MLNPVFSMAHMREMSNALLFTLRWVYWLTFLVPTFYDVSYKVPSLFASLLLSPTLKFVQSSEISLPIEPKTDPKKFVLAVLFCYLLSRLHYCLQIEVLSWLTRTALELVGQSGLGYSFDPLTEDSVPHPYCTAAKLFMYVTIFG